MPVSGDMSFALDGVPPHPPRLGAGGVPCIVIKCVSPLGPAGVLSAGPPAIASAESGTRCIDDKTSRPCPQGNPAPVQIPSQSSRIRVRVWCRMEYRNLASVPVYLSFGSRNRQGPYYHEKRISGSPAGHVVRQEP